MDNTNSFSAEERLIMGKICANHQSAATLRLRHYVSAEYQLAVLVCLPSDFKVPETNGINTQLQR
jgi:hypothetical protein